MKNRKCPSHKACLDYDNGNCENCVFGEKIIKLHKRIDRLKKQNETLTIQRNAWALAAKAVGEDLHATRTELTRVQEENERLRNRITCQVVVPDEKLEEIKNECLERVELDIKAIQADTVRKIADLLWQGESEKLNISVGGKYYDKQEFTDQIAKEMLEGTSNG